MIDGSGYPGCRILAGFDRSGLSGSGVPWPHQSARGSGWQIVHRLGFGRSMATAARGSPDRALRVGGCPITVARMVREIGHLSNAVFLIARSEPLRL
jgi:hypothetical protein